MDIDMNHCFWLGNIIEISEDLQRIPSTFVALFLCIRGRTQIYGMRSIIDLTLEHVTTLPQQTDFKAVYSKAFLSIGDLIVADRPTYVWTVLGSCVSIVLYSPRKKVSALCHAQLSENKIFGNLEEKYTTKVVKDDFRYVACSIHFMLDKLFSMGISRSEIYASIYGGANVVAEFSHKIGTENSTTAIEILEKNAIKIVKKDIGGVKSRTIRHFSDTGETNVRLL